MAGWLLGQTRGHGDTVCAGGVSYASRPEVSESRGVDGPRLLPAWGGSHLGLFRCYLTRDIF